MAAQLRPGSLAHRVLEAALEMRAAGIPEFHGYQMAEVLVGAEGRPGMLSHGGLYKALLGLDSAGFLQSVWENPEIALADKRPRRRLWSITPVGAAELARLRVVTHPIGAPAGAT